MKCARSQCRQPMLDVGDGLFVCSEQACGSTTLLTDLAVGEGLSASSKPSSADERSQKIRLAHERGQATRRRIGVLAGMGYSPAQISAAMRAGVNTDTRNDLLSADDVAAMLQESA
jgi:hypothetical protein